MDTCKYIMIDDIFPVVFHASIQHQKVAAALNREVTSAGFCRVRDDNTVCCFGKSQSLKKTPSTFDDKIIEEMLKNI